VSTVLAIFISKNSAPTNGLPLKQYRLSALATIDLSLLKPKLSFWDIISYLA